MEWVILILLALALYSAYGAWEYSVDKFPEDTIGKWLYKLWSKILRK